MQAVVTVVVVVEEEVVVAEEEVAAAAAGAAAEAAAAEEEAEMMMTRMMMTRMMMTIHLLAEQVHPVEPDEGFSTIKKWNNNWPKSCKINARWRRDDESPASRPPIPSQPPIRMDAVLP